MMVFAVPIDQRRHMKPIITESSTLREVSTLATVIGITKKR
jgi:hypothetical protein